MQTQTVVLSAPPRAGRLGRRSAPATEPDLACGRREAICDHEFLTLAPSAAFAPTEADM